MSARGQWVVALLACSAALLSVCTGDTAGDSMPVKKSPRGSSTGRGGGQGGRIVNTIVVPAYKENANIRSLTERVFTALDAHGMRDDTELVIVDDNSQDGSEDTVKTLQAEGFRVRISVRQTERGLSSAVLHGFHAALGSRLVCMDADLQHPPEKVPLMLQALRDRDYVLGTRYGKGFDVDPSWPWYRVVISKGARLLARPLTPLSDPMSGFFGITKAALVRGKDKISPLGFKIGLELYVKCGCVDHAEVNIFFGKREHGVSKLTGKVMVYYVLHLLRLYHFCYPLLLPALLSLLIAAAYRLVLLVLALLHTQPKLAAKTA